MKFMFEVLLVFLGLYLEGCASLRPSKWGQTNDTIFEEVIQRNLKDPFSVNITSNVETVSEPLQRRTSFRTKGVLSLPKEASLAALEYSLREIFSKQRHDSDPALKKSAQDKILGTLEDLGLGVVKQSFTARAGWRTMRGVNLMGILPGRNRDTPEDTILVIGAHYDTVAGAPGVDDNGSGSAAVLEVARLLSSYRGTFSCTIYFVFFDLEESGLLGSAAFTKDYLVPQELVGKRAKFLGALIIDMLLLYEDGPNAQELPEDVRPYFPEAEAWLSRNSKRGDFLGIWSRKGVDSFLYNNYRKSANLVAGDNYKLLALEPPLPQSRPSSRDYNKFGTFFRSDHASFWYHNSPKTAQTLPAILLSDWGPWRGYQTLCYHQKCDDETQINVKNLNFLKQTVDTLTMTLYELSQ